MENSKRTANCGELSAKDQAKEVVLNGWVHRLRDHGGVLFIDIRDRYGITQAVVDKDSPEPLRNKAAELKFEYCIAIKGIVRSRPPSMVNNDMTTGEIELAVNDLEIFSKSRAVPFMIDEKSDAREELRMKYRYLDLRSFSMQRKIKLRHEVTYYTREYLNNLGFYEIETPTLIKSTPEGARDFLVPSRLHPGHFYALPQSPQLLKQILMVSGFDKYFQIAHCFRDEDARGDRQLEHTQIDIEMSFITKEDIFSLIEGMLSHVFQKCLSQELETPFPILSFEEALNRFGTDRPDTRFGLELADFTEAAKSSGFKIFRQTAESGGSVKVLRLPNGADFSRKDIDELEQEAKTYGAKGLAWMKVSGEGLEGGISKFFSREELTAALEIEDGDLLLFVADKWRIACTALGAVRTRLGEPLLADRRDDFSFAWVTDFPLFHWNSEEERWEAEHHMFTIPQAEYIDTMEEDPESVKGELYDLVCNGLELASGSIRIHDAELQQRIFDILGFSREEAERRFGFLLQAFEYGPPPHGGIAPGLDRLVMLMAGEKTIREVIPFPKNTIGISQMDGSPSPVDDKQLRELHIKLIKEDLEPKKGGEQEE